MHLCVCVSGKTGACSLYDGGSIEGSAEFHSTFTPSLIAYHTSPTTGHTVAHRTCFVSANSLLGATKNVSEL